MGTSWKRVFSEALIAGAIGYFTSALFFAAINLLSGKSAFYTPALFGSILFYGLRDASALTVTAGPVIAFNGVYLLVYLAVGTALAFLAEEAEHGPHLLYLAVLVGIVAVLHLVGASIVLSTLAGAAVSTLQVLAAGLFAAAAMVGFLYRMHPRLSAELHDDVELELGRE